MILRNVAKVQKPVVRVELNGDTWHIYIESAFKVCGISRVVKIPFKNHDWSFKLNEKFKQTTIDGRTFWATVTVDTDGKLVETQESHESEPKNVPSVTTRFIDNGKLIVTEQAGDVVARRTFTRI